MEITVKMTAEEFLEFTEYRKNRAMYAEKLVNLKSCPKPWPKNWALRWSLTPKSPASSKSQTRNTWATCGTWPGKSWSKKRKPPAPGAVNTAQVAI